MTKLSKKNAAALSQPDSFETASAELEKIVLAMEEGQMPLEESLAAYRRGVELLQYCQSKLQNAQQQVRILEADMLKNFSKPDTDEH